MAVDLPNYTLTNNDYYLIFINWAFTLFYLISLGLFLYHLIKFFLKKEPNPRLALVWLGAAVVIYGTWFIMSMPWRE